MKNKCKHEFYFARIIHQTINKSRGLDFKYEKRDYVLLYCCHCGELLIKRIKIKD